MSLEWENNSAKLQIISAKFQSSRDFKNAINDAKQISVSHVINDDVEYGFTIAGLILSYIAFADDLALITLEH